jgi:hypothetical protein
MQLKDPERNEWHGADQAILDIYFLGQEIVDIFVNHDKSEILLVNKWGGQCKLFHDYCCCEHFEFLDLDVDELYQTLYHKPITQVELVTKEKDDTKDDPQYGSGTWSYFKLSTNNGTVTLRGYGSSNGFYSEEPDAQFSGRWFGEESK